LIVNTSFYFGQINDDDDDDDDDTVLISFSLGAYFKINVI